MEIEKIMAYKWHYSCSLSYNKILVKLISWLIMSPKCTTLEPLRAKDSYNRISLQITWAHTRRGNNALKFDRLRLDYGDSRTDYLSEKRKLISEGLKI